MILKCTYSWYWIIEDYMCALEIVLFMIFLNNWFYYNKKLGTNDVHFTIIFYSFLSFDSRRFFSFHKTRLSSKKTQESLSFVKYTNQCHSPLWIPPLFHSSPFRSTNKFRSSNIHIRNTIKTSNWNVMTFERNKKHTHNFEPSPQLSPKKKLHANH